MSNFNPRFALVSLNEDHSQYAVYREYGSSIEALTDLNEIKNLNKLIHPQIITCFRPLEVKLAEINTHHAELVQKVKAINTLHNVINSIAPLYQEFWVKNFHNFKFNLGGEPSKKTRELVERNLSKPVCRRFTLDYNGNFTVKIATNVERTCHFFSVFDYTNKIPESNTAKCLPQLPSMSITDYLSKLETLEQSKVSLDKIAKSIHYLQSELYL